MHDIKKFIIQILAYEWYITTQNLSQMEKVRKLGQQRAWQGKHAKIDECMDKQKAVNALYEQR